MHTKVLAAVLQVCRLYIMGAGLDPRATLLFRNGHCKHQFKLDRYSRVQGQVSGAEGYCNHLVCGLCNRLGNVVRLGAGFVHGGQLEGLRVLWIHIHEWDECFHQSAQQFGCQLKQAQYNRVSR